MDKLGRMPERKAVEVKSLPLNPTDTRNPLYFYREEQGQLGESHSWNVRKLLN